MDNSFRRMKMTESPPDDDCCPVCFGAFTVPCRSDCGHWYCGNCILQVWNFSSASKPCKCPMCSHFIVRLTPEASLQHQQEQQVVEVLESVRKYNLLYVGGARGFVQKLLHLPFFIKRMFHDMMDPDRYDHLPEMRLFAVILAILFFPSGGTNLVDYFDLAATLFVFILRCVGLYCRWRLTQRVRQLGTLEVVHE